MKAWNLLLQIQITLDIKVYSVNTIRMEIVSYSTVNVDDDNMEYIIKYEYEEGQEDNEVHEDQEVLQYEEDHADKEDENGHLTLFDIDIGHNVVNFYLQNFKKVVVYYPIPNYITNTRKEFVTLSQNQRKRVLDFIMRQFAVEGIKTDCPLHTFVSRLITNISRKLRDKKKSKPDINLYIEIWQNLATIIGHKSFN
jgi:hypothetical protein